MAAPMAADQARDGRGSCLQGRSNEEAGETSARLPGVSEDDLIRFKRQMYRKDI